MERRLAGDPGRHQLCARGSFPVSTYYGQIAPELGNYERFRGRVIAARLKERE